MTRCHRPSWNLPPSTAVLSGFGLASNRFGFTREIFGLFASVAGRAAFAKSWNSLTKLSVPNVLA